jgi:hypothetical protein
MPFAPSHRKHLQSALPTPGSELDPYTPSVAVHEMNVHIGHAIRDSGLLSRAGPAPKAPPRVSIVKLQAEMWKANQEAQSLTKTDSTGQWMQNLSRQNEDSIPYIVPTTVLSNHRPCLPLYAHTFLSGDEGSASWSKADDLLHRNTNYEETGPSNMARQLEADRALLHDDASCERMRRQRMSMSGAQVRAILMSHDCRLVCVNML